MSTEKRLAEFAAWIEDRRAAYLAGPDDNLLEVAELDAVLAAFDAATLDRLDPVPRASALARRDMYRTVVPPCRLNGHEPWTRMRP